jgi:hypothetical protein
VKRPVTTSTTSSSLRGLLLCLLVLYEHGKRTGVLPGQVLQVSEKLVGQRFSLVWVESMNIGFFAIGLANLSPASTSSSSRRSARNIRMRAPRAHRRRRPISRS